MIFRFLFRVFFLIGLLSVAKAADQVSAKLLSPAHEWQRAEFLIDHAPATSNNFDPDLIQIDGEFTAPSGKVTRVPAFWFQEFTRAVLAGHEVLTPRGIEQWHLRFTPTELGDYTLALTSQLSLGTVVRQSVMHFSVTSTAPGVSQQKWVENTPDARGFQTSDGKPLKLIGENIGWPAGHGTFDFDTWFEALHEAQGNFARVWLCPWSLGLEHTPGTLNHYSLKAAWQIDHVFEQAEHNGIYLLLCLDHHGMYQSDNSNWDGGNNYWKSNPYCQLQGGPCITPNDFFTDERAKKIYQKRLRYLIGRYGSSPALLAWEFFNEIDNVYGPQQALIAADVASWHQAMGQWLHAHDPYHHLVSTSLTGGSDRPEIWSLPEMDFAMYHSYGDPAPARLIPAVTQDFLARYKKPVLIGEFGVSAGSWDLPEDPHLRGFRQLLWAGALGGSVGTSMSWWWENLHEEHVYPLFQSLAGILARAGWQKENRGPILFEDRGTPPVDLGNVIPGGTPFNAQLALGPYRRMPISDQVAIANPLSAERASEALGSFLLGTNESARHRPIKLTAFFGPLAKLEFRVNSVASDVELIVTIDGAEKLRTRIFDRDGRQAVNHEIDRTFSVDVPPGKHEIVIANAGSDWMVLENLRLEQVLPSTYADGWQFTAEKIGLRDQVSQQAALYIYSPAIAYPAGAYRYQPPLQEGQMIELPAWAPGTYTAMIYNPETGAEICRARATTANGALELKLPPFREDLAIVVAPAP